MDAFHRKLELSRKCLPFAFSVFLQSLPSIIKAKQQIGDTNMFLGAGNIARTLVLQLLKSVNSSTFPREGPKKR